MKNNSGLKNDKYRLAHFVISLIDNEIIAYEYIYFQKEKIIKEIAHPAEIDKKNQLLIIRMNNMHGKDTCFTVNEVTALFAGLPEWKMTRYYQLYDNDNNDTYFSTINIATKYSKMDYEIIK